MLLEDRTAVIYGAGGAIGGAVATAFAREGARVHLAGRTQASLDVVADRIREAGGVAVTARVDALDEAAVEAHADAIVARDGRLDISFNLIAHPYTHGTPMVEMTVDDYLRPVLVAATTTFITARAAARHMVRRGSGVILAFGGSGDPLRDYFLGGTQVAFEAIESMRRQLAAELGPSGVRGVTLRTSGIPQSMGSVATDQPEIVDAMVEKTMLGRAATLEDVGNVAAFAASDHARSITATSLNISCGTFVD
jgi:NAD(P)-dependent dehydrogenase (short-subunit alcohol dehydrogenase family)